MERERGDVIPEECLGERREAEQESFQRHCSRDTREGIDEHVIKDKKKNEKKGKMVSNPGPFMRKSLHPYRPPF